MARPEGGREARVGLTCACVRFVSQECEPWWCEQRCKCNAVLPATASTAPGQRQDMEGTASREAKVVSYREVEITMQSDGAGRQKCFIW